MNSSVRAPLAALTPGPRGDGLEAPQVLQRQAHLQLHQAAAEAVVYAATKGERHRLVAPVEPRKKRRIKGLEACLGPKITGSSCETWGKKS